MIKFYVKDTGIGIRKECQNIIFEKFRKIEDNKNVIYRGSGLGLTISKHLAELLGRSIFVESEPGNGSAFYFTLPGIHPVNKEEDDVKNNPASNLNAAKNSTVLIAEDEEGNFIYIDILLKKVSANTIWAKNGVEAVEACKQNPTISVVLMDVNMPVMNGKEAMKKIKELIPDLPVIALTAYAFNNEQEEFLNMGFDGYIAKPIDPSYLIATIGKYLKK